MKSRLEAMNYRYPFTMDSAQLIEALVNDVNNLNQSLQKLRVQKPDFETTRELSERIEYLNREKLRLEDEIQRGGFGGSGFQEKEGLMLSVTELRRENKFLNQRITEMQSTKREAIDNKSKDYIDKLFSDFNFLKKQLEESEGNLQKLMYENRCLQDRLLSSESQVSSLRKELEVSLFTIKDISNENRSTTEEYYSLKKLLSSYESKHSVLENEVDDLRAENQKLQQFNRSLEQQVSNLNKEYTKSRSDAEMSTSTKIRMSSQVDSLQRQLDILQNENNKLHSLRDEDQETLLELEQRCRSLEESYGNSQEKIRVIQRESQGFCESLREKGDELRAKEQTRKGLEKEIKELQAFVPRCEELQLENRRIKDTCEGLNIEIRKYKQEISETRGNLKYKDDNARQYRSCLEQANKEVEIIKRKLEEEVSRNEGYSQCIRHNSQLEEQLRMNKVQLEESIGRERQLHNEIDQLRLVLQKTDEKLSACIRQYESLQDQKGGLEQENSKLQKNISEVLSRENSKSIEIGRYEVKLQQGEADVEELKRQLNKAHEECGNIQEELRDTKKAYSAEQVHVSRQNDQISQLKDFISSLEQARNDCIKKLEDCQLVEADKDSSIKRLRDECNQLKKQVSVSENMYSESIEEREGLIKQIESLKYDLSRRNDENLNLKNSLKRYMAELEESKLKIKSLQESEENFKRSWRDTEIEKSRLTEINLSMNLQLEDSKKTANRFQQQLGEISKDFKVTDNELRKYEDNYKVLVYERDSLSIRAEELSKELRIKIDVANLALREKDELSQKLRIVSEEYDKILRAYDYLNLDFKKLSGRAHATDSMNETFKKQEEIYIRNIKELEDQLRNTLRSVEMAEYKRIEAEKTSETLIKDIHTVKSFSRDLDNTREDLQRKINNLENEKSFLENRCRVLEKEVESVKSQFDYEKQRSYELESKSIREKESMRRYDIEDDKTRSFKQSNSDLISELYKQIETYKCESLKLEMNYMKLLDELNQAKHQLHRAEARIAEFESRR